MGVDALAEALERRSVQALARRDQPVALGSPPGCHVIDGHAALVTWRVFICARNPSGNRRDSVSTPACSASSSPFRRSITVTPRPSFPEFQHTPGTLERDHVHPTTHGHALLAGKLAKAVNWAILRAPRRR
jgi:hypothetical protein